MKNDKKSPLSTVWNWFCTSTGVVSLSSFSENLFKQFLEWKGFIETLIESYRSIVEPIFSVLTDWLPFAVPLWVGDYVVIGIIVTSSYFRVAFTLANPTFIEAFKRTMSGSHPVFRASTFLLQGVAYYLIILTLWPIILFASMVSGFLSRDGKSDYSLWRGTWQLLCAIILGCVILLAINAQIT